MDKKYGKIIVSLGLLANEIRKNTEEIKSLNKKNDEILENINSICRSIGGAELTLDDVLLVTGIFDN